MIKEEERELAPSVERGEIFIAQEASHHCSSGCRFVSRISIQWRRFENRVSCVGYPDGQAN
jgi:hypothetical protein